MNTTETLFNERSLLKRETRFSLIDDHIENSVNNYLKTPAEIDAEFALQITMDRTKDQQSADVLNIQERILRNGGHMESSASIYHGFMEENY